MHWILIFGYMGEPVQMQVFTSFPTCVAVSQYLMLTYNDDTPAKKTNLRDPYYGEREPPAKKKMVTKCMNM